MTQNCLPIVDWLKNWFTSTDDLLDKTYPVGAIYMSVNNTSPTTLFGGTWQKIQGRFLLASGTTSGEDPSVDNTYTLGDTDGEATHNLTTSEMPSHNHTQNQHRHKQHNKYSNGSGSATAYAYSSNRIAIDHYTDYQTPYINPTGGGQPHNNMPPYLVVNVWKRTA